ncbi:MAG: hypothetical protein JNK81_01465 [Anaerolineales bacterium]|nr:hypothetical protein [Anaerolineales bacterium]
MTEKVEAELIVEVFDQAQAWERSAYIQTATSQGRAVSLLSLGESIPPKDDLDGMSLNIKEISDNVSEQIRELYPRFLYNAAKNSGLLDVTVLENKISLYWLMPISEMSVLRTPLIDKLYALFVLREVLQKKHYQKVLFVTDDELLETPAREICQNLNVKIIEVKRIKNNKHTYPQNRFSLFITWWKACLTALSYWLMFHLFNIGKEKSNVSEMLGLTIFPTLWAKNNVGNLENLAFGDFPSELNKNKKRLTYLAIPTMKPSSIIKEAKYWQRIAHENRILFSHAFISLFELLAICFRVGWGNQLSYKIKNVSSLDLRIDSVDVKKLLIRELQHEQWNPDLLQPFILAYASQKIKNISSAIFAFEFQPIEKAFVAGIKKTNPDVKLIGLQTSLLGKSHLGYYFLSEQISQTNQLLPPFTPLPDYVVAYGETTYHLLAKKLGSERIQLTGPIRYPYLKIDSQADRDVAKEKIKNRLNLNGDLVLVLLALPSLKEEALMIMDWAFAVAKQYPHIYFLVRFHYWAILNNELHNASRLHSFNNHQIVEGDLHELLLASQFMITGTSSVGIEAIASGCMPISYKPTRRYDFGRIQDVEEGAFLYTNQTELQKAINECITQSDVFAWKKTQWEKNLKKLCTPLDGKASSRLYNWLDKKDVFNMKAV